MSFLRLSKRAVGNPCGRAREAMKFGLKTVNGCDTKSRFQGNAHRIRKKSKKRNGVVKTTFLQKIKIMKEIKIIIEKSADSYGAYAENVPGIYGAGDTVKECKQSILEAIETVKTFDEDQIPEILKGEYELVFKFDTVSLLNYYKGIFTLSALGRVTGINERQLQHYSTGLKKPRPAQKKKIETALHHLGEELLSVEL